MDDRTYRRITLSCSCGHVSRSFAAEARHRHNFPVYCKRPKPPGYKPKPPQPGDRYTKECGCGKLLHTRKRVCECGHVFYKSPRRVHP